MTMVIEGPVMHGDGRGRLLGFPTANVDVPADRVPDDGVYAGYVVRADGSQFDAAISVGRRPTYYEDEAVRLVEAHLLDFDGDLYGENVRIHLGVLVRGQQRFASSEELVAQIQTDVDQIRVLLRAVP